MSSTSYKRLIDVEITTMSTENDNDNDSDNSLFLLEQRTDKENYMRIDRVADNLLGTLSNICNGTIFASTSVVDTWQHSKTHMMKLNH